MEFQGKTVEDAIEAGLKQLGIAREEADIEVLDEGKKGGLFGIGHVDARVTVEKKPLPQETKAAEHTDGERAVAFLTGLFPLIGSDAACELVSEDEKIVIRLQAESAKGLIGRRGEVIDAIQTLAGAVANTGRKEYKRVVVDCGNYREEREETLKKLAEKLAAKAVRLGKRVRLEPMNPYERRIIHAALVDNEEVTTKSEGKEPARYVVITPKNLRVEKRGGKGHYGEKYGEKRGGKGRGRDNGRDRKYGDKKPYPKREFPAEATPETSGTSLSRGGTPGYKKGGFSGFFGTYLGKAEDGQEPEQTTPVTEETPTMSGDEE